MPGVFTKQQAADWIAGKLLVNGENTAFNDLMKNVLKVKDLTGSARQIIRVQGHQVTKDFRRENVLTVTPFPQVPWSVTDTPIP